MPKATIKDIARIAKTSTGTVDRVLNNRGGVSEKKKELIRKITKELNYQPNILAQTLIGKKKFKLALLLPLPISPNEYWASHPKGIENAIDHLAPFKIKSEYFLYELQSSTDFIKKAKKLLSEEFDGVILAPIHKEEAREVCQKLDKKNTPYLFIDSFLANTNCIGYVCEDAFNGGRIAASLIDYGTPFTKDILIVNIGDRLENNINLQKRNQGFMSFVFEKSKNTGLKITTNLKDTNQKFIAEKLDQVLSQKNQNIGGIFVTNSKIHLIAEYLEKKRIYDIIVVGYENTIQNVDFLKKGMITFLLAQDPILQGEKALNSMFEYWSTSQGSQNNYLIPPRIINTENLY